jgi:tetratricopeptide (TPR) repeat protein
MNLIEKYQSLTGEGKWADALAVIDEIIAAAPGVSTSWFNRGVCLDALGRHNDAAESFIKAQETNIKDFGIHYRIIRSFTLAGNFEVLYEFIDYSCGISDRVLDLLVADPDF